MNISDIHIYELEVAGSSRDSIHSWKKMALINLKLEVRDGIGALCPGLGGKYSFVGGCNTVSLSWIC
jgi:hypothetical protein